MFKRKFDKSSAVKFNKKSSLEPIAPHRIKPWEVERLNPVYINIGQFPPQRLPLNQVFLWVYTERNELLLGIEHPEKCGATLFGMSRTTWEKIKKQLPALESKEGMGHPTLSASFDDEGRAYPERGKALLGGELVYDQAKKKWVLSNSSGRFGRYDISNELDISEVLTILEKVKNILLETVIHERGKQKISTVFKTKSLSV